MFENRLLKEVQKHIPLVERPFRYLAEKLGVSEDDVIGSLRRLKEDKLIRQISPIYDTRRAGYDSSLVAFRVNPERIESTAWLINSYPGVSHNYERENAFNLWFTIAVPPDSLLGLEETVNLLAELSGCSDYVILRTVKTFKIGVKLDFSNLKEREEVKPLEDNTPFILTPLEREVIRSTQRDIPLTQRPFLEISEYMGLKEAELLEVLKGMKSEGVMRRFSAILYHRKVGFKANGMAVWRVPPDKVEEAGLFLSSFRSVSHCYQRTTNDLWEYNLFSMIHGKTRGEVISFVEELKEKVPCEDVKILFSVREFKKKRVELFSEEFYEWEKERLGVNAH